MSKKNRMSSFFAGIGGFDLAFERAGFKSVYQCEIDPFCNHVLSSHWPDVKRSEDIQLVNAGDIPESSIWCGGFPCQDVSVARGSKGRAGLKGKNSGLFYPFLDLISERKPEVLLLENVVGLLNSHNGQDFRIVLEELSSLGYSVAWRVMNSRYFKAPQSRPRVFICAALRNPELPLMTLYEEAAGSRPSGARAGFLNSDTCEMSGAIVPKVAYCLAATSGRHTGTDWSRTYVSYDKAVRRLTPSECEGLQGFPRDWTNITELNGSSVSDRDTPRYHALGNSVAVPLVEWIAKRLKKALKQELRLFNGFDITEATKNYSDFDHKSARRLKLDDFNHSIEPNGNSLKWASGGFVRNGECIVVSAPAAPSKIQEKLLVKVIENKEPADHYYLSANAAQGIIRRVESQNRTLFPPMDKALRAMIVDAVE